MIGEKIKILRKQNSWTQEELSTKLGIKQPQLNRWETGKLDPSLNALKKISKIFDVSIDTIVFDEKDVEKLTNKNKSLATQLKEFDKLNDMEKQNIINLINNLAQNK